LDNVNIPVSATKVRHATLQKRSVSRFLDPAVAEYIRKMALYRNYGKHNDH
jgi:nicotinic acid mononucleotide adenylyltransferase